MDTSSTFWILFFLGSLLAFFSFASGLEQGIFLDRLRIEAEYPPYVPKAPEAAEAAPARQAA